MQSVIFIEMVIIEDVDLLGFVLCIEIVMCDNDEVFFYDVIQIWIGLNGFYMSLNCMENNNFYY